MLPTARSPAMPSFECGITLAKFQDIKEGDVFECFKMEEYRD